MKIKYTNKQLKDEMLRVYKKAGEKVPILKDWPKFSKIDSATICRRFGGKWSIAWERIGISIKKQTIRHTKIQLINDFKKAYEDHPYITSNYELLKLSGHRIGVIQRYFVSLEGFLNVVKLDARKRIYKQDIIDDYAHIYDFLGRPPTKKDIAKHGKYKLFVYLKHFKTLNDLMSEYNVDRTPPNITEKELIDDLIRIKGKINKTPTTTDVYEHSIFSGSTYDRYFGNFTEALKKAGLTPERTITKYDCKYCKSKNISLPRHMKNKHPDIFKQEESKVLELYKNGMSNKKIAIGKYTIFHSPSAVSRVVEKYTTSDERKKFKLEKIKNSTISNYASGKMDRVIKINIEKSFDPSINSKISESLKESYNNGTKKSWNKGKTKETNTVIKLSAEKTSRTIKNLYATGELQRKNESSTKRNRIGVGFNATDRRNIKRRSKYRCEICGISQEELEDNGKFLECDHILPICKGGIDDWENNGQALCPDCHKVKTSGGIIDLNCENVIDNNLNCDYKEIIKYNGNDLVKHFVSKMGYRDKYMLSRYLLDYFLKYDFGKSLYHQKVLYEDAENIKKFKCTYNREGGLITINENNNSAIRTCHYFFPNIMNIKKRHEISIQDALNDPEILLKIIMNRLGGMLNDNFNEYFDITPASIISGAKSSGLTARGSIFKPAVAKAIYNYWVKDGDVVYDYSSGFGGRLFGFYASGKNATYIGTDVEPKTYEGLKNMTNFFNINAEIYNYPSEEFVIDGLANFVFSSPPYFDHEIYSDYSNQSIKRYPIYKEWLEYYWRKTVKNIKKMLAVDGVFAINVGNFSNIKMERIYEDMTRIILEENFYEIDKWQLKSKRFHFNKNKTYKYSPVIFYQL